MKNKGYLNTIRLETRDGGFVAKVRVTPLLPPAEVVAWGDRIFVLYSPVNDRFGLHIYREGLAVRAHTSIEEAIALGE